MPKARVKKTPRLDVRPYRGQWVVIDGRTHKVVSHDASLDVAERAARERGVKDPILFPVPKSGAYFVGTGA